MARLSRLAALARRFFASLREEGLPVALRKARTYLSLKWHGFAPSMLPRHESAPPDPAPERYLLGIWSEMARGEGFHAPRDLSQGPRLALIGDLNLPQCRKYRIEQLAAFWNAQGVPCDYAHYQDIPRSVGLLQQATHLLEYRLQAMPLTHMYRYEARRLGLPVLFDIDDPLFSISAYETYGNMAALDPGLKAHFLSEAPKYAAMMDSADLVTVSTPALAEHARAYTRRPVCVRRNFADQVTLEDGAAAAAQAEQDGLFRLVFASGSQGHETDFNLIRDEITDFVTAAPNRRLTILGHFDKAHLPEALHAQTELHPFTPYERYLTLLAEADLAVMPLCDDLFNRCKSAVRVIDAASVGLAAVVSPVGDQVHMIEEGKTGFVARNPGDWQAAFQALASDPARARDMGQAARQALETRWVGQPAPHLFAPELLDWVRT